MSIPGGTTARVNLPNSPDNTFNGYLDDVRIDNKALTPAQVSQLANP